MSDKLYSVISLALEDVLLPRTQRAHENSLFNFFISSSCLIIKSILPRTHSLCRWSNGNLLPWSVWTATHVTLASVTFDLRVVLTHPQRSEIPVLFCYLHSCLCLTLSLSRSLSMWLALFLNGEGRCPNEGVYLKWTLMALNIDVKMLSLSS